MSALTLFTDDVFYICKIKDVFFNRKVCSVKYRDNKKWAARVLAVCNNETVLLEIKSNLEGRTGKNDGIWTCVNTIEISYSKVCKEITKITDDTVLFADKVLLSENCDSFCIDSFLANFSQDRENFFDCPPKLLRLIEVQLSIDNNIKLPKAKSIQKRKRSCQKSNDAETSNEFEPNTKHFKYNEELGATNLKQDSLQSSLNVLEGSRNVQQSHSQCSAGEILSVVEDQIINPSSTVGLSPEIKAKPANGCRRRLNFFEPAFDRSKDQIPGDSLPVSLSSQVKKKASNGCRRRLDFFGPAFDGASVISSNSAATIEEIQSQSAVSKAQKKLESVQAVPSAKETISVTSPLNDDDRKNKLRLESQVSRFEKAAPAEVPLEDSSDELNNNSTTTKLHSVDLDIKKSPILPGMILNKTFTILVDDITGCNEFESKPSFLEAEEVHSKMYFSPSTRTAQELHNLLPSDTTVNTGQISASHLIMSFPEYSDGKAKDFNISGGEKALKIRGATTTASPTSRKIDGRSLTDEISFEAKNLDEKSVELPDDTEIVPETDCEDGHDIDLLINLRAAPGNGILSSISPPADLSPAENRGVPEGANTFDKIKVEDFVESEVAITDSLLDNLIENWEPQSAADKLDGGDEEKLRGNEESMNFGIDPFQNNVILTKELSDLQNNNITSYIPTKESKELKVPMIIQTETIKIQYKILKENEQSSGIESSKERFNANLLEAVDEIPNDEEDQVDENDDRFPVPNLHSTMCDPENESPESQPHSKAEKPEEFSENGDSSDNYDPNDDHDSDSGSDEYLTDKDDDEEEPMPEPPEPLNITHGGNPPASAPDDRDLQVAFSSAGPKKHFCLYCQKFQTKLARHLTLVHNDQADVKKFMLLPPGNRERQEIIAVIRKEGDFLFNSDRRFNNGVLVVCRRPNERMMKNAEDFSVCGNCKGEYAKSTIRHHFRQCANHDGRNQRIVLIKGRKIASRVHARASSDVRKHIFPYLKEDEVVRAIRYDELVTLYANKLCQKFGIHRHHDKDIRCRIRYLGRFLIAIRGIDNSIQSLTDVFQPRFYDAAVNAVRVVTKFDPDSKTFKAPTPAANYGTLLKFVGEILRSESIKTENLDQQKRVEDFLKLLAEDYGTSINRAVAETQHQNRRRKEVILPSTEDIKKLYNFVIEWQRKYYDQLTEKFSREAWRNLMEMTLLSLQIFNRRRAGETERLYLEDFHNYRSLDHVTNKEAFNALSNEGKKLARKYVRFEIRGKLGRTVGILLDADMFKCLNALIEHRKHAGVPEKNKYLFGLPSTDKDRHRHLSACDLMREFSVKCGAEAPETLRGTMLRKHIATKCINLNLTDGQVADLCKWMGHSETIHKDIYRQPILETDIIQVSKLLNVAQGLDVSDGESEEDIEHEHSIPRKKYNKRKTKGDFNEPSTSSATYADESSARCDTPASNIKQHWSTEQKNTAISAFEKQLETGKVPSGKELQHFIDSQECMKERTVPQLRTWLHTQKNKILKTKSKA